MARYTGQKNLALFKILFGERRMKVHELAFEVLILFGIAFAVSLLVSYLYSLIAHGAGIPDWALSFRNGIIFAIIIPLVRRLDKRR